MAVVALQFAALLVLLAPAQFRASMATTTVVLKTEPVDPVDLMRGHYADLSYEIGRLGEDQVEWTADGGPGQGLGAARGPRRGDTVYVFLDPGPGFSKAISASTDRPPPGTIFIRGTVTGLGSSRDYAVSVKYGIEKVFISEARARRLEYATEPLAVTVKLDGEGRANVISVEQVKEKKPKQAPETSPTR